MRGGAPELDEREVDFAYDFPMKCPGCGGRTPVTAADYALQIDECHTHCAACGHNIHFGPVTAAIRDPHDPVLEDSCAVRSAWYHTSTEPDWPATSRQAPDLGPLARHLSAAQLKLTSARHVGQALHVGTYEAAIENMLRRMRNQLDGANQFYLYRVALHPDTRIEPGYRDENEVEAGRITQADIRETGCDAVRYLNAWEATGSLSLALHRDAILAVQSMAVPIDALNAQPSANAHELARVLHGHLSNLPTHGSNLTPSDRLERLHDGAFAHFWRLKSELERTLTLDLLDGAASPVVADRFERALASWEVQANPATFADLSGRWAAMAALIARPADVQAGLRDAPWATPKMMSIRATGDATP